MNGFCLRKCYVITDTQVTAQFSAVMENEKYFPNAKEFNPQRFIDDSSLAEKVSVRDILALH